ncbi:MAG TPA: hypothetical protein PKI20_19795 [Verrucomicrobiota bacterium]|nr:hypothetical protein [Verrucomicrobiota bacterium]
MSTKLQDLQYGLLIGELQSLLNEFRRIRTEISEGGESASREYLKRRVKVARDKLDDLKRLQQREKEIQARRRRIAQDNARRD